MDERKKIEDWIQKMYWISQLPEDDYKRLRRNAAEGRESFESKFGELRRKYGKNKAPVVREHRRMPSHKIPTYIIGHPAWDVKETE